MNFLSVSIPSHTFAIPNLNRERLLKGCRGNIKRKQEQ